MFSGKRLSVICALVAITIVAGCSSSASSGDNSKNHTSAAAAPITVGLICACTGANSVGLGTGRDVYDAWVKTTNAAGGINRHPVNLIVKDDASNPGNSATAAQQLISQHVDAIVDNTPMDLTWAAKVEAAKIPVIGFDLPSALFDTNPDFYPQGQTNRSALTAIVATAKSAGATRIGTLYCAEAASCQQLVPTFKAASRKQGLAVNYTGQISATAPNYTAQCVAAKEAHIDTLAIFHTGPTIARVIADCARQDYHPRYVIEERAFYPILLKGAGQQAELWIEFADLPYFAKNATMQAMTAAVDKYYPGLRAKADVWNQGAAEAWLAGMLLEAGAKAGGLGRDATPSADVLIKGLTSLRGETLNGTAPPLTFPAGKPHSVDCWFTAHVQNGIPKMVNSGQTTCQKGS